MRKRLFITLAVITASAFVLAGCAGSPNPTPSDDNRIHVVASTIVYGSLAAQVGGDRVRVSSIITNIAQDPHSYEATARDRLTVQGADLLIENGGGYDHFMEQLREGLSTPVITAVTFSNHFPESGTEFDSDHDHNHGTEGFNEHVWYDLHTMIHVVEEIAEHLVELDPTGAAQFNAAADALIKELSNLETLVETHEAEFAGMAVFITEPLPGYLAESFGLDNHAPEGFAAAVEEGLELSPALLLEAINELASGHIKALLSNAQTGGVETDRIEAEARANGIPIVTFMELLPETKTYAEWMQEAIDSLAAALRR